MLNGREDVTFVFFSAVGEPLSKTLEVSIDSLQKMKEGNKIFIEFFSVIRIAMPNACVIKIFFKLFFFFNDCDGLLVLDVRKYWRHRNCKCIHNLICITLLAELFLACKTLGKAKSLVFGEQDCSRRFTVGV